MTIQVASRHPQTGFSHRQHRNRVDLGRAASYSSLSPGEVQQPRHHVSAVVATAFLEFAVCTSATTLEADL